MNKEIHIVTHDIPWPANFGGMVDLFYKVKSLHAKGIKIHLHCFQNRRPPQTFLNRFCASVHYYTRKKYYSIRYPFIPFIVQSRRSDALLKNLLCVDCPIIFEGIHTTFLLKFKHQLSNRKIFIRLHNVESQYYFSLFKNENNLLKKGYYYIESVLLKKYERTLSKSFTYLSVSQSDADYYQANFFIKEVINIPVFLPWVKVESSLGVGSYCLYHGNLSINENEKVVKWLAEKIFSQIDIPFVIAGKDPSSTLKKISHLSKNICIIENPSEYELDDLIKKAQLNILPSFNTTGVKLKILHALYLGRHCLVNTSAIDGSGLNTIVHIVDQEDAWMHQITSMFSIPFTSLDKMRRAELLNELYNNELNADKIIALI